MAIEIVEATESRIPDIIELWKEFMEYHRDIDPRFPMRDDACIDFNKRISDLIGVEDAIILVALDGRKVAGFSISQINKYPPIWKERDKYGFIDTVAITADYRRKGIGEQMLNKTFEWFASRGIHRIEVGVSAKNQVGYSFWRKHGFRDYTHRLYLDM